MVKSIRMSDNSIKELTADEVINQFQKLVYKIVNQNMRNFEKEDCIQMGNIALYNAYLKYDVNQGSKFITFATTYIKNYLHSYWERETRNKRYPTQEMLRLDNAMKSGDEHYEIISYGKHPTERIIEKIFIEEIENFIREKKPKQYKILKLLEQDYKYVEIQKIIGDRTHQNTLGKIQTLYKNIRKEFKSING